MQKKIWQLFQQNGKSEVLCWEFKGKVDDDTDFWCILTVKQERKKIILVIVNTPKMAH